VSVSDHYANTDLERRVIAAIAEAGKDLATLVPDDLVAIDEFHTRGRPATVDLANRLAISSQDRVLDVGAGLGGPARYLVRTFGCTVTGIDLMPEFVSTAKTLSRLVGMAGAVDFQVGNALSLPFADRSFDVVWCQNVSMNIPDRAGLYREIGRVLVSGGRYGFTELVATGHGDPIYPQPWATDSGQSFLLTEADAVAKLGVAGFTVASIEDHSRDALALALARAKRDEAAPSALGTHRLLGDAWPQISANIIRNFQEGRLRYIQGVAVLSDAAQGA
jgi:SAM-dependent methyltransferase